MLSNQYIVFPIPAGSNSTTVRFLVKNSSSIPAEGIQAFFKFPEALNVGDVKLSGWKESNANDHGLRLIHYFIPTTSPLYKGDSAFLPDIVFTPGSNILQRIPLLLAVRTRSTEYINLSFLGFFHPSANESMPYPLILPLEPEGKPNSANSPLDMVK